MRYIMHRAVPFCSNVQATADKADNILTSSMIQAVTERGAPN
jgi:hypothetical protein